MSEHRHDNDIILGIVSAVIIAVFITLTVLDLGWMPDWASEANERLEQAEQRLDALEEER